MFYPKQLQAPLPRLWTFVFVTEVTMMTALYFVFGQAAFFLLGPFLLYNLFLFTYPYWMVQRWGSNLYKGSEQLAAQNILKESFKRLKSVKPELLIRNTELQNILIFTRGKKVWVIGDKNMLAHFSNEELKMMFHEMAILYRKQLLSRSTLRSALHLTLPFWPIRKGLELIFSSDNHTEVWHQLNYKTFHRRSLNKKWLPAHLLPCLFLPALGNYSRDGYFSLYTFLRERLINSMRPPAPVEVPLRFPQDLKGDL